MWDVDVPDGVELEQPLVLGEQLLHEVLVQHLRGRHVELQLLREVLDEVRLGLEAREQLLGEMSPLLGAQERLLLLLRLHLLLLLLLCLHLLLLLCLHLLLLLLKRHIVLNIVLIINCLDVT